MPNRTKSSVRTRKFAVEGTVTTVTLENECWDQLEQVARDNDLTIAELVELVENRLGAEKRLSAALRAYVSEKRMIH